MCSSSGFLWRTLPLLILMVWVALPTAAVAQQPRRQEQGDVFSSGGPCREQPPFDCRCPVRQKGLLTVEKQRNRGRVQFLQGNLQRAERTLQRGLSQANNQQERQKAQKTYDQEVKTWTDALKEEERFHTCRVGGIEKGCPLGWEQTCAPKPSRPLNGGLPPPKGREPERRPVKPGTSWPDPFPMRDPGYWRGFSEGMYDCWQGLGELGARMKAALESMGRGDFVQAAKLLGASQSDAAIGALADGLRHLWDEFSSGRSVPLPGKPFPTPYEIGKHGAERLCLLGLAPTAGTCVMRGTLCAVKTSFSACGNVISKIAKLRRVRKPTSLLPPSPIHRGLLLEDEKYLQEFAAIEGKIFIVRDSSPYSLKWVGRAGYKPKPVDVKGKTLKPEDLKGLPKEEVNKYVGLASAKGLSLEERTELLRKGYKIASPGDQEIIRGPNGEKFYSDTDLHGVYNLDGTNGWSQSLLEKLECRFFDRGVQHGPHDNWGLRNDRAKAGVNYGPQVGGGKTITAIFPDGTKVWVRTLQELKNLYRAIGVDWKSVYPYH